MLCYFPSRRPLGHTAPGVVVLIVTVCGDPYAPLAGVNVGVTTLSSYVALVTSLGAAAVLKARAFSVVL